MLTLAQRAAERGEGERGGGGRRGSNSDGATRARVAPVRGEGGRTCPTHPSQRQYLRIFSASEGERATGGREKEGRGRRRRARRGGARVRRARRGGEGWGRSIGGLTHPSVRVW